MRPWKSVMLSSCTWVPASAAWAEASSVPVEASAASSAPASDAAPGAESAVSLCASASAAVSEGEEVVAEDWPAPRPGPATAGERPGSVSIDTAAPVASIFDTSLDMYSVPSVIHRTHINGAEGADASILQCRCERRVTCTQIYTGFSHLGRGILS